MKKTVSINKYPKAKKYVVLYFHAHQPYRISNYSAFDVNKKNHYFDGPPDQTNEFILNRVTNLCYKQANEMFLEKILNSGLKVSYSITGTLIEQLENNAPEVIDLFRKMVDTKKTELIGETYYHSLAFFHSVEEFARQVDMHRKKISDVFSYTPKVFRNTELTYRNDVGEAVRQLGYKAVFAEGWDPILKGRTPNEIYNGKKVSLDKDSIDSIKKIYSGETQSEIKVLLKNYNRSDDVAFRFQLKGWEGYPVTADKFAEWVKDEPGQIVNLFMDYETIGEHHRVESGIFEFYKYLPEELAKRGIEFLLPSEAIEISEVTDDIDFPYIVSWADHERDLSAWTGNDMQKNSLNSIYKIEEQLQKKLSNFSESEQSKILDVWGKLQTSDHFYYMSTKYWSDGDVHKYFSPYNSPYEAFIYFSNALRDFKIRYLDY